VNTAFGPTNTQSSKTTPSHNATPFLMVTLLPRKIALCFQHSWVLFKRRIYTPVPRKIAGMVFISNRRS